MLAQRRVDHRHRRMKDGVIADFSVTEEKMLQHFIQKAHGSRDFRPSPALFEVFCTARRSRAPRDSRVGRGRRSPEGVPRRGTDGRGDRCRHAGCTEGARADGVDIGGGTSEVAVISLNGIVYASSVRIGGDRFDDAITNYVRRNYGILIGEATAERIKHEIGSAYPGQDVREISVKGQPLRGCAAQLHAIQRDPRGAARALARHRRCREGRARADAAGARCGRRGARHRSTGAEALLPDIDKLFTEETGLPVVIADEPLTCVARGGRVLELLDEYGPSAFSGK